MTATFTVGKFGLKIGGKSLTSESPPLLHDVKIPMELSQATLSKNIDVDYKVINRIVNGHSSVTPDISLRLSKAFGTTSDFWPNLQQKIDIYEAKGKLKGIKLVH